MTARIARWAGVISLVVILVACGATTSSVPVASPTPPALIVDIDVGGGRTLQLVCVGPADTGRPTVVFESGMGLGRGTWSGVIGDLKSTDRACAYDRPGVGQAPSVGARTTQDQVDDLHALLEGAGITGPVVLVGHSLGGWNVLLYAAAYPDQVVGAVLVDILPPSTTRRFLAELPPETANEPEAVRDWRDELTTFQADESRNPEHLVLKAGAEQVGAAPGLGDRPVVILWAEQHADLWMGLDADLATRMEAALQAARGDVEALAEAPEIIKVDGGHMLNADQPGVVVEAVRTVLDELGS